MHIVLEIIIFSFFDKIYQGLGPNILKLIKYFQQNALRYHKTSNQLYTTFLLKFLCKNERAEGKTFRTSIEHLSCDSFLMPDFVKNKNDIARLST